MHSKKTINSIEGNVKRGYAFKVRGAGSMEVWGWAQGCINTSMELAPWSWLHGGISTTPIDYCSTAWMPSLLNSNKSKMMQLSRLLNRAARIITGSRRKDCIPTETLLAEAGMESLSERAKGNILVNVYKAVHNKAPSYLQNMFKWMSPPVLHRRTRYATKQLSEWDPHMLNVPKAHVQSFRGCLQFQGPTLWNELSAVQRQQTTQATFKNGLMQ